MPPTARPPLRRLLVLDVDGTVSRIYRDEERVLHQDEPGWRSWMSVDEDVVDALDRLVEGSSIDVAWLTTWPHDQVAWLVQEPLRGKLSGPYVPWQNWPKQGWRIHSLISYVRETWPAAVAWADDRASEDDARRLTAMTEITAFVIRPDRYVGLTLEDVDRIATVLDGPDQIG